MVQRATNANLQSRGGPAGIGYLGYALDDDLRFEIEGDYRSNRFSPGNSVGFANAAAGNERRYGPMFNVIYDFSRLFSMPHFAPCAGLGVG